MHVRGLDGSSAARPLAAAAAAALAALSVAVFGPSLAALVAAAACVVLVAVSMTDLERRIVPNRIVLPALLAALVVQTARQPSAEWLLAALGAGGFLLAAALVHPPGLGMGDVKLAAFLGAWLGRDVTVALAAALVLALVPSVVLLLRSGLAARKAAIPLAPFLALGGLVALFFGERLMNLWLGR